MNTVIIGQGYNIEEETSVGKELIEHFNSGRYTSFTCLVAFASYGGISALTPYINKAKENGNEIKIILGIDQNGTSKEALEEVLAWDVDSKIYHTDTMTIFHPKIYLFENRDIFTLIVGSNNLTTRGLVQNIECSLLITDTKDVNSVHGAFYNYWKGILDGTEENLYTINKELIDQLFADKKILTEVLRANQYDNNNNKENVKENMNLIFNKTKIQKYPHGYIPKRLVNVKKIIKNKKLIEGDENSIVNKTLPVGDEVLIAEIGAGPRWKQVNFPITIFENFFGAERGNNEYTIKLLNISKDGTLSDIEIRQAVTVKSNNFRFEIHCAETDLTYPGNNNRPIGIFIKLDNSEFLYQVLMPGDEPYNRIKEYLYKESLKGRQNELKRHIVHIEAIHALYPSLII